MKQKKILTVAIFGVAFGFMEAAVVVYLRQLLNFSQVNVGPKDILLLLPGIAFLDPQSAVKIITKTRILQVEQFREIATLVMLAAIAQLSGKSFKEKLAYFFLAFGFWDIFYYLFLKLAIGWPQKFSDLDIFFLLPVPWVGPVIFPILISFCLIVWSVYYLVKVDKKIN